MPGFQGGPQRIDLRASGLDDELLLVRRLDDAFPLVYGSDTGKHADAGGYPEIDELASERSGIELRGHGAQRQHYFRHEAILSLYPDRKSVTTMSRMSDPSNDSSATLPPSGSVRLRRRIPNGQGARHMGRRPASCAP